MEYPVGSIEDRARRRIGNAWWWDGQSGRTRAMSFEELCQVIREFDGPPRPLTEPHPRRVLEDADAEDRSVRGRTL